MGDEEKKAAEAKRKATERRKAAEAARKAKTEKKAYTASRKAKVEGNAKRKATSAALDRSEKREAKRTKGSSMRRPTPTKAAVDETTPYTRTTRRHGHDNGRLEQVRRGIDWGDKSRKRIRSEIRYFIRTV